MRSGTGKIVSSPNHGNFDFQQISMILPTIKFPKKFYAMEVSKRLEVSWKFFGNRNDFHDLKRTRSFQYRVLEMDFLVSLGILVILVLSGLTSILRGKTLPIYEHLTRDPG